MPADDVGHHSCFGRQLNRLRKVACGDFNAMAPRREFRDECMEERNVRGIGEIDPDAHLSEPGAVATGSKLSLFLTRSLPLPVLTPCQIIPPRQPDSATCPAFRSSLRTHRPASAALAACERCPRRPACRWRS